MKPSHTVVLSTIWLTLIIIPMISSSSCVFMSYNVEVYSSWGGIVVVTFNSTYASNEWLGIGLIHDNSSATYYFMNMNSKLGADRGVFRHSIVNSSELEPTYDTVFETTVLPTRFRSMFVKEGVTTLSTMMMRVGGFVGMVYLRGKKSKTPATQFGDIIELISVPATSMQRESDLTYCQNSNISSLAVPILKEMKQVTHQNLYKNIYFDSIRFICLVSLLLLRKSVLVRARFKFAVISIAVDGLFGAIRFTSIATFLIYLARKKGDFLAIATYYSISYFISLYGTAFAFIVISLLYSLQIFRYFLIANLHKIIQKQSNVLKISKNRLVTISRLILSNIGLAITLIMIITIAGLAVVIHLLRYKQHLFEALAPKSIASALAFGYQIASIGIAGAFIDIALNMKPILKRGIFKGIWYHYTADPLYFRLEMLLASLLLAPGLAFSIALIVTSKAIFGNLIYAVTVFIYPLFFYSGFPIIIEVWKRWICCGSKSTSFTSPTLQMIETVLTDPQSFKLIKDYATREFSVENIVIWELLWKYKQKGGMKLKKAHQIYNLFLSTTSTMEVNISSKTKKQYKATLDQYDHTSLRSGMNGEDIIPFTEFTGLYADVVTNINETYSRFAGTSEYKAHMSVINAENYLLQNNFAVDETLLTSYRKLGEE